MPDQTAELTYLTTVLQLGQTLNSSLDLSQLLHFAIEQGRS